MEMEMEVEMMVVDVAPAAATGRKRPAAAEDAAGLKKEWRREELRGKAAKWNSCEAESRDDYSPRVRELLHEGNRLLLRHYAAVRARRAREELARLCPNSGGILK